MFYTTTIAAYTSIMGNTTATSANARTNLVSFDRRQGDLAQYWTPNWGGFSARFGFTPDESKIAGRDSTIWSGAISYEQGRFMLSAAHEKHNDFQAAGADDVKGTACAGGAVGGIIGGLPNCAIGDSGADQFVAGLSYDLSKRTQVYGLYSRLDNERNARYDFGINPAGIAAGVAGLGHEAAGFPAGPARRRDL